MFFKNLLRIVSLVAVSGITKTLAGGVNESGMTACGSTEPKVQTFTVTGNCEIGDASTYCIADDGKIYGYSSNASTCAINTPGIYAFTNAGGNGGSTSIELGSNTSITAGQLLLYRCSYGHENKFKCSRTYGYALINNNVYTVKSDKTVVETPLTTITEGDDECKTGSPGIIIKTKELCLKVDGENPILSRTIDASSTTPNYYIMANVEGNIFTGAGADNKNIVVEARPNAIVLDEDAYDYCVTASNNALKPTFKEFCDNNPGYEDCKVKAEYEAGPLWDRSGDQCTITLTGDNSTGNGAGCTRYGYYLINASTGDLEASSGVLFQCNGEGGATCAKVSKIGYFKNAAVDNKYIKCTAPDTCSNIEVTGKDDCKSASNGDVIDFNSEGTTDVLCLDNTVENGIPITAGNNDKEFFAPNGSIFLTGKENKYAKVTVKTTNDFSVTLSAKASASSSTPSTYVYTDADFKVYGRGDSGKAADVCASTKIITEFKYSGDDTNSDLYEKKVVYKW